MISAFNNEASILTFFSLFIQVIFWFGMMYFEVARYDDEKISAPYGWPRIYYKDIVSIKSKLGDIIIKSDKREIAINKDTADQKSLEKFIEYLDLTTLKYINETTLL
jgi:low affinity Fe/Cu permease